MKKKALSLLLVLAMCLTLLPTAALAEGTGTSTLDGRKGIVITKDTANGTTWTDGNGGTATWQDYSYLVLNNYNVDSGSNPAITIGYGCFVTLKGSNSLTSDSENGAIDFSPATGATYVNIRGTGTLDVNGGSHSAFKEFDRYCHMRVGGTAVVKLSNNSDTEPIFAAIDNPYEGTPLEDTYKSLGNNGIIEINDSGKLFVYGKTKSKFDGMNASVYGSVNKNADESDLTEEATAVEDGYYTVNGETAQTLLFTKKISYVASVTTADGSTTTKYEDVKSAVAAAKQEAGCTVKIIAEENQLQLANGIYLDTTGDTAVTFDLNGHSLGGYSLNIGGSNHSGKVKIIDSSNGNGAIGIAVRDNGDVTFNGATATSCLQLEAYGGSVKFYGGNIHSFTLGEGVTYKDFLPEGYAYYTYSGIGSDLGSPVKLSAISDAASAGNYLAVRECRHKSVGSDMKCEYCGKDFSGYEAMLTTASGSVTYYEKFSEASEAAQKSADSTIKLLNNVSTSNGFNFLEGTFTIDLNGKNMSGGTTAIAFNYDLNKKKDSTAKVTLINTTDVEATVSASDYAADMHCKNARLIVGSSDKTENNIKFSVDSFYRSSILLDDGSVEIYGGSYIAKNAIAIDAKVGTTLTIHNGTFEGATAGVKFMGTSLTIEGGEFKAANGAFGLDIPRDKSTVKISDGTFYGINTNGTDENGRSLSQLLKDGYSFKKADGSWLTEAELAANNTTETVTVAEKPLKRLIVKINDAAVEDSYRATINEKLTFTVETDPADADATVTWSIDGISVDGSYTPNKSGTYTLKCESTKDNYRLTKTVTITVVGAASITAAPENAEIVYGTTELPKNLAKLTATIKEGYSVTAQWFVKGENGADDGVLTSDKALTDGQSYSSAAMSILDAGTYQVYCHLTVRNSENTPVDEFDSDAVTLTVKQKTLTKDDLAYTGETITKVYDGGMACTASASGFKIKDDVKVQSGDTLPTVNGTFAYVSKNVSSNAKIIFTTKKTENKNYILPADLNLELSGAITPCEVTISGIQAINRPYKANDKSVQLTGGSVVGVYGNDDVTVDLSKAVGEMTDDAMGQNKTVTVTGAALSGQDAGNYMLEAQPTGITVNITKAEFEASVSINGYTYGAMTIPTPSVSNNPENGPVTYYYSTANSNQAGTEWKNITGATLGAGTYYMYAVISETDNYASVTTEPSQFVIGPKTLTKADLTYSGDTKKVYDGTTNAPDGAKVTINSSALVGEDTLDVTGTFAYDTKNVTATKITFTPNAIESGNYRLAASEVLEVKASITAKPLTGLDFSSITVTKVYDGTTDEGTLTGTVNFTGVVHEDKVSIKAAPGAYADANVGENNKTIVLTLSLEGSDKANYMLAAADRTHEFDTASITKADGAVTPPTAKNLTYTGEAQTLVNEGSSMTGTIKYKLGDGDYSAKLPMVTDAGEYIVYYMVDGDENHNDVDEASIKVSIAKATPTLKITADKSTLRGGSAVKLTVSGAPEGSKVVVTQTDDRNSEAKILALTGNGEVSVSLSNTTAKYTFTVVYAGDDNYNEKEDSCEVSVTRRTSSGANSGNTITVPSIPNGTVTANPSTASKGETVTITTKPSEGYELGDLTVKDASGNTLPLTDKGDGKFTFTMPGSKVSVEASFVKAASTGFADVPTNAYFADAVEWAVDKGITNGLSDTMFGPYESCTRAQIVTFLWRAAGSPEPKAMSNFSDVPASAYYAKAVAWAVENGITNGMTETTFAPDATCTRGQSVTFLYRALGKKVESSANFTDVKSDAFYADAVNWAVASDVTNGTSATTFSPNADCTRAEIVTFLYRAYQGK